MKRLQLTRVEIIWVDDEVDVDSFHDSIVDNTLDSQDSVHETSDGKFEYIPKEVVHLEVVKLE